MALPNTFGGLGTIEGAINVVAEFFEKPIPEKPSMSTWWASEIVGSYPSDGIVSHKSATFPEEQLGGIPIVIKDNTSGIYTKDLSLVGYTDYNENEQVKEIVKRLLIKYTHLLNDERTKGEE